MKTLSGSCTSCVTAKERGPSATVLLKTTEGENIIIGASQVQSG